MISGKSYRHFRRLAPRILATGAKLPDADISADLDEDFTKLPILGTPRRIPPVGGRTDYSRPNGT